MKTLLLAAGQGSRWRRYKGVPKHLVTINGQRLLDRTVEQFATFSEVEIIADPLSLFDYTHPQATRIDARLDPTNFEGDRFLSSKHRWVDETMLLMYGDVWYSDHCVNLLQQPVDDWVWVARWGPSSCGGKPVGEGFGFVLPPTTLNDFHTVLEKGVGLRQAGLVDLLIGWTVYRLWVGYDPQPPDLPHLLEVDDWTDDFDHPVDYVRWMERYRRNQ